MDLDEAQARVVGHDEGRLVVLGGPGTGKTSVLKKRFLRLAASLSPDRILLIVPNRAQKIAIGDELARLLLDQSEHQALVEVPVYTWHGLAHHLVTRHHKRLGYSEPPLLMTSPEQWADTKEALAGEPAADWPHHRERLTSDGFVDEVVDFCIRASQRLMEDAALDALGEARSEYREIVSFYRRRRRRLRDSSRMDYPTLLEDAGWLLASYDDVREGLQQRFPHIIVDEAQELALVQQRILRFLHGPPFGLSLVVAADPDSAIEAFRGAEPRWIEGFANDFGDHERIDLTTSYRMGPELGERAGRLISPNGEGTWRPQFHAGKTTLHLHWYANATAEAEAVARRLRTIHLLDGIPYEEMAVLLAQPQAMLPGVERALTRLEVPFSVEVADRALERERAVRAIAALVRFALGEEVALSELMASPVVGIDDRAARELARTARMRGITLHQVLEHLPEEMDASASKAIAEMLDMAEVVRSTRDLPADEAFWAVWSRSSWCRGLAAGAAQSPSVARDLQALTVLSRSLARFVERRRGRGTLREYLHSISRADFGADPWLPPERAGRGVAIHSFHAAKGKQWRVVAVAGCVEGAIPKGRRAAGLFDPYFLDEESPVERVRRNEQEDRRVFYVALTRASERCLVTASAGTGKARPSRFVEQLAGGQLEMEHGLEGPALTLAEAALRRRRALQDTASSPPDRVAALVTLWSIAEADPWCRAADPSGWWWRWDWTEGAVPVRLQSKEEDLPPDRLRTSYSRIGQYENCGLAYLGNVVLGLDSDTSHNMAFGTWIHQIFEDCEKDPSAEQAAHGRRRLSSLDTMLTRFEELFDESIFPSKPVARQFRRDGMEMLKRYAKHLHPGKAEMAEHAFSIDFEGHRINGRIDRIDRRGRNLVVSDFKTSRSALSWDEARDSLQLAIYYLAARSDPEIARLGDPVSMQIVYPGQYDSRNRDVVKRCQEPKEAERALERLPALIEGVLSEDFRPSPEADCRWCRLKPLCPLWPEGRELPS